jgi:hypothetical protein
MSGRARPIDVLPLLREDRSLRVAVLPALLLSAAVYVAILAPSTLHDDGMSSTAAWLVGAATALLALTTAAMLVKLAFTDHFTQAVPLSSRLFPPGLILPVALAIYSAASATLDAPPGVAIVAAGVVAGAMLRAVRRHQRWCKQSRADRALQIGHPTEADEVIAELREELRHPSPDADPSAVELLLASTIADKALLVDRYDDLGEAERILERALPGGNPAGLVGAAMSIVTALLARARGAGDVSGLEQALGLIDRTIDCVPSMDPTFMSMLLQSHATGMLLLRTQAEADGDSAAAERLLGAAIDDEQRARDLPLRWSSERADIDIELASLTWRHPQLGGLDASIERCRAALRSLRFRGRRAREEGYVTLAGLLGERSAPDGGRPDSGLTEAIALCEFAARWGRRPHQALARLPAFLEAAGADAPVVGEAFRRAFAATCAASFDNAAGLAMDWILWADACCDATEAAEAHLCFMRTVVTELQRLRLRGEAPTMPWELGGLTEAAAFWLLAAGRGREAALALDLGGSVVVNERMYRERGDIDKRLNDAGREDLADRWLLIGERMGSPARSAGDARRERSGTITVGGQTFRGRFASRDVMPLADYERLVREISRTPGFEDVDAAPSYEDLREAACEGPLVYLGATAHGGFALVVTEDAAQPQVVTLAGLTSEDVESRAQALMGVHGADAAAAALEPALVWLWRTVLTPLTAALAPRQLVTLVPVGALGLLPIHAAGMARRRDGTWRDRTGGLGFRYAPNARLLTRAHATARSVGTVDQPVAAVDEPRPGGYAAGTASVAIADRLGARDLLRRPLSSTAEHVLATLGEAPIWLVACLVDHDPVAPLSTCLLLARERLPLDVLLAPDRVAPRLAILTSCRTTIGSEPGIGELVSLPTALLNAGAAGVVASHMVVDEHAATVLSLGFFKRLLEGAEPARALAQTQAWMAAVTNREVADALGPAHPFPPDLPAAMRRDWERGFPFTEPRSWAGFSYCGA